MQSLLPEPGALTRKEVPRVRNLQTPIVLNDVTCRRTFTRLDECFSKPVEYCDHTLQMMQEHFVPTSEVGVLILFFGSG